MFQRKKWKMRLFIAINFDTDLKNKIYQEELKLQDKLLTGHITKMENIHLTLVFIGEVINPKEISSIIEKINYNEFDIFVKGLNYFNKGKRLYYLDIERSKDLENLYNKLYDDLTFKGYNLEYKKYVPHITLAREATLKEEIKFDELNIDYHVNKISLMESKRINGDLVYNEIYFKKLNTEQKSK